MRYVNLGSFGPREGKDDLIVNDTRVPAQLLLIAQEDWHATIGVLRAVAKGEATFDDMAGYTCCAFPQCHAPISYGAEGAKHTPQCPVTISQRLTAGMPPEESEDSGQQQQPSSS